jgi:signal peptidase II
MAEIMNTARTYRLVTLILILGCTAGCDQVSKHLARARLSPLHSITLPGGVGELRLAENLGSFLSLGTSLPHQLRFALLTIGVGAGLLCLFVYLVISPPSSWLSFIGWGMICAGGMSNLLDRALRQGHVTDFIFISVGPLHTGVFNMADLTIVIGIAAIALNLRNRRHGRSSGKIPQSPHDRAA